MTMAHLLRAAHGPPHGSTCYRLLPRAGTSPLLRRRPHLGSNRLFQGDGSAVAVLHTCAHKAADAERLWPADCGVGPQAQKRGGRRRRRSRVLEGRCACTWRQMKMAHRQHVVAGLSGLDPPPTKSAGDSASETEKAEAWENLRKMMDDGAVWEGQMRKINRKGVVVKVGATQGLIPFSQLSRQWLDGNGEHKPLLGQRIRALIIEADGQRNMLTLSERRLLLREAVSKLEVGSVVEGVVTGLADFGAFVTLKCAPDAPVEIQGLIPISQLSWDRVMTVDSVLAMGQSVRVKVKRIEERKGRVSLSLKDMEPDPVRQTLDSLQWKEQLAPVPEVLGVIEELKKTEGVSKVHVSRQAEEKHIFSQDMEMYMTRSPTKDGYMAVIRVGNTLQELELQGTLDRTQFKEALQKALRAQGRTSILQ